MPIPIELVGEPKATDAIDDTLFEFSVFAASLIGPALKLVRSSTPRSEQGYDGNWTKSFAEKLEDELSTASIFQGGSFGAIPVGVKRCAIWDILAFISGKSRKAKVSEFLGQPEDVPSVLVSGFLRVPRRQINVHFSPLNDQRRWAENFALGFASYNTAPPVQLNLFSVPDRSWRWFDFQLGNQRPLSSHRCPAEILISSMGTRITLTNTSNRKPDLKTVRVACGF